MSTSLLDGFFLLPFLNSSLVNETLDMDEGQENSAKKKKLRIAQAAILTIAFMGIFVNFISILALRKSKELRNPTTTLILNLCLADLLFCVSNLITHLRHDWSRQNEYVCRWNTMAKYCFGGESVYLVVAITINRFMCVVFPNIYRSMYKPKLLAFQIALTWFISFFWTLLPAIGAWGKYGYDSNVGLCTILRVNGISMISFYFRVAFVTPTTTFAICYPIIFWVVHKSRKRAERPISIRTPATLNAASEERNARPKNTSHRIDDKELKILKVMFVVVFTFVLFNFPIGFIKIRAKDAQMPAFVLFSYFLVNLSNVVNPIIYIVMSAEYRKAYIELFQCKKIWLVWSTSSALN